MAIKVQPTYTEEEVSRALRESEGKTVPGFRKTGHAESEHELIARGRRRRHATLKALRALILDPGDEDEVDDVKSAFWNCQAKAIVAVLNRAGSQAALSALTRADCWKIVLVADVGAGGFKMVRYDRYLEAVTDPERFYPIGEPGLPSVEVTIAAGIVVVLGKLATRQLYIHTAYPLTAAPAQSVARIWILPHRKKPSWSIPI